MPERLRLLLLAAMVSAVVLAGCGQAPAARDEGQRLVLYEFYRMREQGLDYEGLAHSFLTGEAADRLADSRLSLVAARMYNHSAYRILELRNGAFLVEITSWYLDYPGGQILVSTYRERGRLAKTSSGWAIAGLETDAAQTVYEGRFASGEGQS